jgi:drug/metabolite transporter (DMT)-like permease
VERNDIIAWAMASFVWLGALALFVWLGAREQPRGPASARAFRTWLGSRIAGGLVLWATVFTGALWVEKKLELRPQPTHRTPVAPASVGAQALK